MTVAGFLSLAGSLVLCAILSSAIVAYTGLLLP